MGSRGGAKGTASAYSIFRYEASILGFSLKKFQEATPQYQAKDRKNVGSVRFELTIDGSLRHASVLQRVIISYSGDPLFITCKDRWSPSPFRTRPRPLSSISSTS